MDSVILGLVLPYLSPYEALRLREVAKWCTFPSFNYLRKIEVTYYNVRKITAESLKFIEEQSKLYPYSINIKDHYSTMGNFLTYPFVRKNIRKIDYICMICSKVPWTSLESLKAVYTNDKIILPDMPRLRELHIKGEHNGDGYVRLRLGKMPNLELLCLNRLRFLNNIELNAYPKLTTLKLLKCNVRYATGVNPWLSLAKLEKLIISGAYTNLSGLSSLKYLDCSYYNISSLSFLSRCKWLQRVNVSHCNIKDLSPLTNSITWLDASENRIEDISCLSKFKSLKYLNINHNNILDISPLENCSELKALYAQTYFSVRANALQRLVKLEDLCITINIEDIEVIRYLTNIIFVVVYMYDSIDFDEDYMLSIYKQLPRLKSFSIYFMHGETKRIEYSTPDEGRYRISYFA